jgi:hypothetical protein
MAAALMAVTLVLMDQAQKALFAKQGSSIGQTQMP